jgi:hypothetical protein
MLARTSSNSTFSSRKDLKTSFKITLAMDTFFKLGQMPSLILIVNKV